MPNLEEQPKPAIPSERFPGSLSRVLLLRLSLAFSEHVQLVGGVLISKEGQAGLPPLSGFALFFVQPPWFNHDEQMWKTVWVWTYRLVLPL